MGKFLILLAVVAGATGDDPNDPANEELTEQEKFAQEILSLFNYPVYTGMISKNIKT